MASTENESNDWAELARKHANTNPVERLDEEELKQDLDDDRDKINKAAEETMGAVTNGLSPLDL